MKNLFLEIPGLIVVIPAIIAMRGNISTALGSRLGSAYHLGLINADNLWNDNLKQNVLGSIILSFLVSILIGILAYVSSLLMGVAPSFVKLVIIVLVAGIISAIILTLLTILIIYLVFKRGYDPDNITGPALATFGDIITMICIFGSSLLFVGVSI
jgi:mgtE-like transporter